MPLPSAAAARIARFAIVTTTAGWSATPTRPINRSLQTFGAAGQQRPCARPNGVHLPFRAGHRQADQGRQEHLAYLARRRPSPITSFICRRPRTSLTTRPRRSNIARRRAELDGKRIDGDPALPERRDRRPGLVFEVAIHDAPTPGLPDPSDSDDLSVGRLLQQLPGSDAFGSRSACDGSGWKLAAVRRSTPR